MGRVKPKKTRTFARNDFGETEKDLGTAWTAGARFVWSRDFVSKLLRKPIDNSFFANIQWLGQIQISAECSEKSHGRVQPKPQLKFDAL